jgi:hypothetical protein
VKSRADSELRIAKGIRFRLRRLGRALLVLAMTSSSMVASFVGEALVLHQHGGRSVHLHALGFGELRSDAAWSPWFGHRSDPASLLRSGSQSVRILAIIATGSVFVSSSSKTGDDATGLDSSHHGVSICDSERQPPTGPDFASNLSSAGVTRSASAVLLLRNHTLVI